MPPERLPMRMDLLDAKAGSFRRRRHHNPWWWLKMASFVVIFLVGTTLLVSFRVLSVVKTPGVNGAQISLFDQVKHLISNRDRPLDGESQDRINILLSGIGGAGHDGPYLTDTLMLASIKPSTHQVALLSIPRDLAVNLGRFGYRKINSALALGRDANPPNGGDEFLRQTVSDLAGMPIQYFARVDFTGFKEAVDALGGVDLTVDSPFQDYQYPTENNGIKTIRFTAGRQHMDGATALIFARSRHGNNGEGSDFARARRQQKILLAMRDKALSLGSLVNPKRIADVLNAVAAHSTTSMELWQIIRMANIVGTINENTVINKVLDSEPNGLLKVATGIDGAFLLVPKAGDEREIRALAQNIFLLDAIPGEKARVTIKNSTGRSNAEQIISQSLERQGIAVTARTTGPRQTQTEIYDFSGGQKPATLAWLQELVRAQVNTPSPLILSGRSEPSISFQNLNVPVVSGGSPDFLVILGTDTLATTVAARTASRSAI